MDLNYLMEKELKSLHLPNNRMCVDELTSELINNKINVNLTIKNEQSLKTVIINTLIRIFIHTIVFVILLTLRNML